MKRRQLQIVGLVVALAVIIGAVLLLRPAPVEVVERPTPLPTPLPTRPRPGYTAIPEGQISPVIVSRSPAPGEELRPDGVVELVFDRAMNRGSVESALLVSPSIAGKLEWADDRTVRFRPAQPLQRGALFDLVLSQGAQANDGAQLAEPFQFRFMTAGFLEVAQVVPAQGAQEVEADSTITVIFNRPVVPLVVVEDQATLPQPLSIEPAVSGKGEWLNTSIYVFHPDRPLAGGTTYTARVAGLVDAEGNPLQQERSWQFTTISPEVLFISPENGAAKVSVEPVITLQFNQPIDQGTAEAAFQLLGDDGPVAGTLKVISETLIFTPAQRLGFDQGYRVVVGRGLTGSAGGTGMRAAFESTFRTVPLPRIISTRPANGDRSADPHTAFEITFNAPINIDTILPNLRMTPAISPTQVYSYFNDYEHIFYLSFGAQPSSDYSVEIGPGIADPYGNTTGQSLSVSFSTGPLAPSVQLAVPGYVATYNAQKPAQIGLTSVNLSSASLTLYRRPIESLKNGSWGWPNGTPPDGEQLRRWTVPLQSPLNQNVISKIDLVEGGGRLEPGVYLLLLDQPQGDPQAHTLVVSSLNLTLKSGERDALVWANDLQTGQPLPNIALDLYDNSGNRLGTITTGADGVARTKLDRASDNGVLAIAQQPFAAIAAGWSNGINAWDFGLQSAYDLPELAAFVYTDRPIYRPGQRVDFKGLVRAEDDVKFSLISQQQADVTVTSTNGEQLYQEKLPLSANGSFSGGFTLGAGAALGSYSISVSVPGGGFNYGFTVAAYRAPEFQVSVKPQAAEIVRGNASSAMIDVSYFFGGPVANVPVQWNVLAQPYHFAPDWAGRYQFGANDNPWYYRCWECWWMPAPQPQPILSGSGVTDLKGQLSISIPAELKDSFGQVISDSVQLTIEAVATGRDNQAIAGRETLVVHSGEIYLGLASQNYIGRAGEEQKIDLVTASYQGSRLSSQTVEIEVFRVEWENSFIKSELGGSWSWTEKRTSVSRQQVTSDGTGAATFGFTPDQAGSYDVRATARDRQGHLIRSDLYVWVYGDEFISWRRENNDRITLISDKTSYKPGETARILIPSPFQQPHWALISVERGGILSYEMRRMESNSTVYDLPLTGAHAPNIYVSVVLLTGPEGADQPASFKVGLLPINVAADAQTLKISVTPAQPQSEPGKSVRYDIQVTDLAGQPVAAELSLDLVDKAVLSLLPRTPDALREAFYAKRALGISTSSGLSISAERFIQELNRELERQEQRGRDDLARGAPPMAGEGGNGVALEEDAAFAPGLSDEKARAATGQSASAAPLSVREEFADTAYWNAMVSTDAAGRASVEITLPDNLTTWVMRGVGLTAQTQLGEGISELVATKPLLIRPVTPRFFVVGDTAELAANISNNTDAPLEVQVALASTGLSLSSPLTQTVQVAARGESKVRWLAQAGDVTRADLIFSAVSGQYSDASKPRLASGPEGSLPVYRYSVPEIVGTGGQITATGARTEIIGLPPNIDLRSGELTVRIDASLAAGMRDGLDYLEHFPYECTEQTVSRFLPNVLTARALKQLGISNPELEARLPGLVEEGLGKLYREQHEDGGWGWWSDDESNPHISAYVVFGMLHAKESGFKLNEDALQRGLAFLQSTLGNTSSLQTRQEANQHAWLLYVLALGERGDLAELTRLFDSREKLSLYARALLALGLSESGVPTSDGKITTLLSDINNEAIYSATGAHWEEQDYDWWSMNTDTRSTAIVLDAMVTLDPENAINPNIVRWLMVARKDGIWETTQETGWALIALTNWMVHTGELKANYTYGAWLNDKPLITGQVDQSTLDQPIVLRTKVADLLVDTSNKLQIGRGEGEGRLYYTAHLRAFLPVEEVKALDRGVIVRRRYTLASCTDGAKCPEVRQAKLGDVIKVELTIIAPHDLYYLQVEDPLPAGAEAIDTGLATTSVLAPDPSVTRGGGWFDEEVSSSGGRMMHDWYWGWWNWYSRSELRDEKVALFADYLPSGTYLYSYTMRATLPGEYRVIPTTANELYFPEVYGRGDGQLLTISEQ